MFEQPDSTFPNGIPNPILLENHQSTRNKVLEMKADIGIAFDGDFDRCFFFDERGEFIPGEFIVGLLAKVFLDKEPGTTIVHDPRVVWNTQDLVRSKGGLTAQSRTGHTYFKKAMRAHKASYGGEMSAHHYFRDFAYCDSGMIPWLLVIGLMSRTGLSLSELVAERVAAFPSSGEINFKLGRPEEGIVRVVKYFEAKALCKEEIDGVTLEFKTWRFNLRKSNTECVVRLNMESRSNPQLIQVKLKKISELLLSE